MFPGSVMMAIATLPFRDISRKLLQVWAVDDSERLLKFGRADANHSGMHSSGQARGRRLHDHTTDTAKDGT